MRIDSYYRFILASPPKTNPTIKVYESPKPARLCSESEEKPSAIFLAEKSAGDWKPRYKRFHKAVF